MRALANLKHSVRREVEGGGEDFDALLAAAGETVAHAIPPTGEARQCAWCGEWRTAWDGSLPLGVTAQCECHNADVWPEDEV